MMEDERMQILERISRGEINAAEGMQLLERLPGSEPEARMAVIDQAQAASGTSGVDMDQWKRWWIVPFAIGVAITTLAGVLMGSAIRASGYGFWFFCLWVPFALGMALTVLGWASRTSRWLHVRVNTGQDEWPRRIAISMPLPVRFTAWVLRWVSPRVPALRQTALDEFILALDDTTSDRTPLYVDVADGEGGERVQVYIG